MASDILGPRPSDVGDCGAGSAPVTYGQVAPTLDANGDFLVELENWIYGFRLSPYATPSEAAPVYTPAASDLQHAVQQVSLAAAQPAAADTGAATAPRTGIFQGLGWTRSRTASWGPALGNATVKSKDPAGGRGSVNWLKPGFAGGLAPFGWHTLRQT